MKKINYDLGVDPSNFTIKHKYVYRFFKRLFDIVVSFIAIILLLWLFIILAILVKCDSKGPAIYVSERVGKMGKIFKFYKFITMRQNAEKELEDLLKYNETGGITF